MYIRDFESYKSKRKLPLLISIIYSFLTFSFILAIIFTIITPIKINEKVNELKRDSYYFIQSNLFFINFNLQRDDLIILNSKKVKTESIFFNQLFNILSLNLLNRKNEFDIYKIIGIPHDIINIKDGVLFINENQEIKTNSTLLNKDQTFYLSSKEYYCISTSINSLDDSLYFGIVERDYILGKIIKSFYISYKK